MVTKIIINLNNDSGYEDLVSTIFNDFFDVAGFDLTEYLLTEDSECGLYEHLYIFGTDLSVNRFINILLEYKIPVLGKEDFTNELINIINNGEINTFKSKFLTNKGLLVNENVDSFYFNNITTDMILDKINNYNITYLTELDKSIMQIYSGATNN